ncbi:hypothetical protein [Tropicimonas sp. IMCC34011]|uniref:hypothetical protein n=1 Tax=Tropicimonas sp. IMCC34011 TaxID=2248759 RepID=UPI001E4AFFFB|nr:hypothetical protein [Tropicimonas sp. IMCC34011]
MLVGSAILAPLLATHAPYVQDLTGTLLPPSGAHFFPVILPIRTLRTNLSRTCGRTISGGQKEYPSSPSSVRIVRSATSTGCSGPGCAWPALSEWRRVMCRNTVVVTSLMINVPRLRFASV